MCARSSCSGLVTDRRAGGDPAGDPGRRERDHGVRRASGAAGPEGVEAADRRLLQRSLAHREAKFRIERQIVEAIRHAHKGSCIRIAVYSFDRVNVAKALINAHKRGVREQVLHNDHQYAKAMKMLKKRAGHRPRRAELGLHRPDRLPQLPGRAARQDLPRRAHRRRPQRGDDRVGEPDEELDDPPVQRPARPAGHAAALRPAAQAVPRAAQGQARRAALPARQLRALPALGAAAGRSSPRRTTRS